MIELIFDLVRFFTWKCQAGNAQPHSDHIKEPFIIQKTKADIDDNQKQANAS